MRLDRALVARGLARSRTEAQALIASGSVRVEESIVTKASADVDETASLVVDAAAVCPYVSRGGLKLAGALDTFGISVAGKLCLDVGASTGGFTDCLLQRGAKHVIAIDVGHGQMAPILAADPRVTLHEGINARDLDAYFAQEWATCFQPWESMVSQAGSLPFDIVVADLSFISLTLVVPALEPLGREFILLVKPQFEVGPAGIGKGGIVRDPALRQAAVERVILRAEECGLQLQRQMISPIHGGDGNEEYLILLKNKKKY